MTVYSAGPAHELEHILHHAEGPQSSASVELTVPYAAHAWRLKQMGAPRE
jgi:hypothetical protein